MSDLRNLVNPTSISSIHDANSEAVVDKCESSSARKSNSLKTQKKDKKWEGRLRFPIHRKSSVCKIRKSRVFKKCRGKKTTGRKSVNGNEKHPVDEKVEVKVTEEKLARCRMCQDSIKPGTDLPCSIHGCQAEYHLKCVEQRLGCAHTKRFKCPQHYCYLCKQKSRLWRCVRCEVACHVKCSPFPEHVKHLRDQPGQAICWKHDWREEEKQHLAPVETIAEIFAHLPVPDVPEEFAIDKSWNDIVETESEPPPYIHITQNVYLVKKKRNDGDADTGCTNCISCDFSEGCMCRSLNISCSKSCTCSDMCTNRPFRKEKKIKVVETERCGWGVEAAESISEGDFIIEYVGEVIDDVKCEKRFWDMKKMGNQNFYLCEVSKDFTIDATYKGNASRFLNHSCDPNCKLEKWELDGETRLGIFAAQSIEAGEPLTYDYRFIPFGPKVKCQCGAQNCKGYLGAKTKKSKVDR